MEEASEEESEEETEEITDEDQINTAPKFDSDLKNSNTVFCGEQFKLPNIVDDEDHTTEGKIEGLPDFMKYL